MYIYRCLFCLEELDHMYFHRYLNLESISLCEKNDNHPIGTTDPNTRRELFTSETCTWVQAPDYLDKILEKKNEYDL